MRAAVRAALTAALAGSVAACGSVTAPGARQAQEPPGRTGGRTATGTAAAAGPVAGSQEQARRLAMALLARLRLPAGTHRSGPATGPLPRVPPTPGGPAGAATSLDVHQMFLARQPAAVVAAYFGSHVPPGMRWGGSGQGGGSADLMWMDVSYTARTVPPGIDTAEVVLTVAPAGTGGATVRADAQVTWFPPRSAAEHIDPARYHVLTITVTSYGARRPRTVHTVVTSQAAIAQLAAELDRAQTRPAGVRVSCPAARATYQLALAASRRSRPAVVVSATKWGCTGTRITVGGLAQPPLGDENAVTAIADRLTGVNPLR